MDKSKTKTPNASEEQALEYIQINHKNKIEELSSESHIAESMNLLNSLSFLEENIGGEINKFFLNVLPENKEGEALKVLIAIANKSKSEKKKLEDSLTYIMNRPETDKVMLTKELCENLSIILKEIFRKIKRKSKIKTFAELKAKAQDYLPNLKQEDLLKKYRIMAEGKSTPISNESNAENENKIIYKYKEYKEDKNNVLPIEMLILMRKFNIVKTLKLTINNDYNPNDISDSIFDENDLQNNILFLLNLEWLFQSLFDLEVDLSNDNLIESEINLFSYKLVGFSKLIHKEIKVTTYQLSNPLNHTNFFLPQKSVFSQIYNNNLEDDDHSSDKYSSSIVSTNNQSLKSSFLLNSINEMETEENQFNFGQFNKKYNILLKMIIIYGYFIRNMPTIIRTKFIIPLNLGDEIFEMLRRQKIFINDFHFLSFLTNTDILHTSIEFNSLDSQTFEKLLNFLNQNHNITLCNLSFFPSEEYFKSELLYKILQTCDENFKMKKNKKNKLSFNPNLVLDLKGNEDIDNYILRKLSEYFEKNLKKFFYFLSLKTIITELSLNFDLPTILTKNGYYNNVLIKFFLDLFILIDNPLSNIKILTLNSRNFVFDSRKYPILNDFCDKLHFYLKKEHKLTNLTFIVRFYRISKIYRFIPYNLTQLSIGPLDYETFNCLVDYLTSADFSIRTKLSKLTIYLNNTLIYLNKDKIYEIIIRLLTEYPKGLTEISLYTFFIISYLQLNNLLLKTNYNTLPNIFMQFSSKSILKDKLLEEKLECDLSNADKKICIKTDNFIDLYAVKRNKKKTNDIINLMANLSEKNKEIMQYNIYTNIEKFLCEKEKKKIILQFN